MIGVALVAAALAAALAMPAVRLPESAPVPPRAPRSGAWWLAGVAGAAFAAGTVHGRTLVLGLILVGALAAFAALVRRARARAAADARRLRVVEACEALASELRAGQPPQHALDRSLAVWPDLAPVAAACRLGSDVPAAFRRLAQSPGAGSLREVAAAWQVSERIGSGLASSLSRVADSARAQLTTHRLVAAELASAQATARMVALLPVVIVVLSQGSGARPLHFLLQTTPGLICLACGLGLAFAGMGWVDRIVARVDDGGL